MSNKLARGFRQFQTECAGMFQCHLVYAGASAMAFANPETPEGLGFRSCLIRFIRSVENEESLACLCGKTQFTKATLPAAFVFNWPANNEAASAGMLGGLCTVCSSQPPQKIFEDVRRSLSVAWPGLRRLAPSSLAGGGHA